MSGAVHFSIRLDDEEGIVQAGKELRGTVILQLGLTSILGFGMMDEEGEDDTTDHLDRSSRHQRERSNGSGKKDNNTCKDMMVRLRAYGQERIRIWQISTTRCAKRTFFDVKLDLGQILESQTRRASSGATFTFPFCIRLPRSLPGSTQLLKNPHQSGFSIAYSLLAVYGPARAGKRRSSSLPSMTSTVLRAVIVHALPPSPNESVSSMMEPMHIPIKGFVGARTKAKEIVFGASVPDTYCGRGETLALNLSCRNDYTGLIERVSVKLLEQITWRDTDGRVMEHHLTLAEADEIHMPPPSHDNDSDKVEKDESESEGVGVYSELKSGRNRVNVGIPYSARDSYIGKLIEISHCLEIKVRTRRLLMKNGVMNISVRLGASRGSKTNDNTNTSEPLSVTATLSTSTSANTVGPEQRLIAEAVAVESEEFYPSPAAPESSSLSLPKDAVQADLVKADSKSALLGGNAIVKYDGNEEDETEISMDYSTNEADSEKQHPQIDAKKGTPSMVQKTTAASNPSIQTLLHDLSNSMNDHDLIASRLDDPTWMKVLQTMTQFDLGLIISHVSTPFEQPRVAALLARRAFVSSALPDGESEEEEESTATKKKLSFTCAYAAAAVRASVDWVRPSMVERLMPLCVDRLINQKMLYLELNDWNRTLSQRRGMQVTTP